MDATMWPHLRSLEFSHRTYDIAIEMELLAAVPHAALHCPALTSVGIKGLYIMDGAMVDVFLTAAREFQAWPSLQDVCIGQRAQYFNFKPRFREVWPHCTIVHRRERW
jgi:hypothetical protein